MHETNKNNKNSKTLNIDIYFFRLSLFEVEINSFLEQKSLNQVEIVDLRNRKNNQLDGKRLWNMFIIMQKKSLAQTHSSAKNKWHRIESFMICWVDTIVQFHCWVQYNLIMKLSWTTFITLVFLFSQTSHYNKNMFTKQQYSRAWEILNSGITIY